MELENGFLDVKKGVDDAKVVNSHWFFAGDCLNLITRPVDAQTPVKAVPIVAYYSSINFSDLRRPVSPSSTFTWSRG